MRRPLFFYVGCFEAGRFGFEAGAIREWHLVPGGQEPGCRRVVILVAGLRMPVYALGPKMIICSDIVRTGASYASGHQQPGRSAPAQGTLFDPFSQFGALFFVSGFVEQGKHVLLVCLYARLIEGVDA